MKLRALTDDELVRRIAYHDAAAALTRSPDHKRAAARCRRELERRVRREVA